MLKERIATLQLEGHIQQGDTIKVKLSGDGTWVIRYLHVVNFTFTIRNDPEAMSSNGNYLIAIFQDAEWYYAIKTHMADLENQVAQVALYLGTYQCHMQILVHLL